MMLSCEYGRIGVVKIAPYRNFKHQQFVTYNILNSLVVYFSVDDRIQWVRTMEVFAMIAMVVSLLCGITKEYVSMYNRMLLKIGAGSGFTAG